MNNHLDLGRKGEEIARDYLTMSGFMIVTMNFTAPIGHKSSGRIIKGEIDIIAYDLAQATPVLVFVEVKTRSRQIMAAPEAAVDRRKRLQIIRTARVYRRIMGVFNDPFRFDVLSIIPHHEPHHEIRLLKNFFQDKI